MINKNVVLESDDCHKIHCVLMTPNPDVIIKASILFLPGVGIKFKHYEKFASYLVSEGFQVLFVEYRGVGMSYSKDIKISQASLSIWAKIDAATAYRYLSNISGTKPYVFGHSFGGQILCLSDEFINDSGAVIVASQVGYWRFWQSLDRVKVFMFWYIYLPLVSSFGKYTIKTSILKTSIPSGVAKEWAKWGRSKSYMKGYDLSVVERTQKRESAIKAYAFTDDIFAPPKAAQELWSWFPSSKISGQVISPEDMFISFIGHFSAFDQKFRDTLWVKWKNDFDDMLK